MIEHVRRLQFLMRGNEAQRTSSTAAASGTDVRCSDELGGVGKGLHLTSTSAPVATKPSQASPGHR